MGTSSRNLLVVDDDEQVLFVWSNALTGHPSECHVITAQDGQQALDRIDEQHFALIITDLQMPIMNGYELTEIVRARDLDVTIAWHTGNCSPAAQAAADRLSVLRCLQKPLTVVQIRQFISEALTIADKATKRARPAS
jgi:CheY-like chemotaxis protein